MSLRINICQANGYEGETVGDIEKRRYPILKELEFISGDEKNVIKCLSESQIEEIIMMGNILLSYNANNSDDYVEFSVNVDTYDDDGVTCYHLLITTSDYDEEGMTFGGVEFFYDISKDLYNKFKSRGL